jgi:23S rRNA pseudouridine2605 synthase
MRLQRYLALAGIASRRAAEEMIVGGKVRVNGKLVRELGSRVEDGDRVEFDGRTVVMPQREVLVLNKPVGVVTTMSDPEGRRTVEDLVRAERGPKAARLVPVGRLDYDTSGVLLLTNDGDLAHALTHPRFGVDKVYRATLRGRLEPEAVEKLRVGIFLEGRRTSPAALRVVTVARDRSVIDLTLHEGRYRQVRRMFEAVGHPLVALERLSFGPVSLGSLRPAHLRELSPRERKALDVLLLNSRGDAGRAKGTGNSRRDAGRKRRSRGDTQRD